MEQVFSGELHHKTDKTQILWGTNLTVSSEGEVYDIIYQYYLWLF